MQCKSILIVEDEPGIRDTLRMLLEMEGYPVITAENGQDAITKLEGIEHPCLVLCDLMMPVMNGWEFIAAVKKDKLHGFATIPVIVVSAAGDYVAAKHGPIEGYIKKPLDIEVLLKAVRHYCGPPPSQEQAKVSSG